MDIKKKIKILIDEAKKRYNIGDVFLVAHSTNLLCTIKSFEIHNDIFLINDQGWFLNLLIVEDNICQSATICHNGKWAKKVKK